MFRSWLSAHHTVSELWRKAEADDDKASFIAAASDVLEWKLQRCGLSRSDPVVLAVEAGARGELASIRAALERSRPEGAVPEALAEFLCWLELAGTPEGDAFEELRTAALEGGGLPPCKRPLPALESV